MEKNNKVSVGNASVGTYIKLKTLEHKIATQEDLQSEINSYPPLVNYLRDNTDGSTWYGADVLISLRRSREIQSWKRRSALRSVVISEHAREIAWLFSNLRDIFADRIDSVTKYFFYADLAHEAIDRINASKDQHNVRDLLLQIIQISKRYL